MNFGDKLKEIRKTEGLSQEQLAEQIGVSRQAITKWETGKGIPDIENMMIIAEIFKITLDELVSKAYPKEELKPSAYHSETIYDIDRKKHFEIHLGSANTINLVSGTDEKLHIDLSSDTFEQIGSMFKIKLDENKGKLEVTCIKQKGISRYELADSLYITITLPIDYTKHCELEASAKELNLSHLVLDRLEYDGDATTVHIKKCSGSLEFTGKTNYDITIDDIHGRLDVNQWKAQSIVHISKSNSFHVQNKGRWCSVYWKEESELCNSKETSGCEDILSISGLKSELIIDLIDEI